MSTFKTTHIDESHTTLIDIVGNDIYIGVADVGSLTTDQVWSIKKITKGTLIPIKWAEGTASFINTWDDRVLYSYL